MQSNIQYTIWRDRGGNFGVQCLVCKRVHWTGEEATFDPTNPKRSCDNCVEIKTSNLRNQAAIDHQVEISEFEKQQEKVTAHNINEDDPSKHLQFPSLDEYCKHPRSQPIELR